MSLPQQVIASAHAIAGTAVSLVRRSRNQPRRNYQVVTNEESVNTGLLAVDKTISFCTSKMKYIIGSI